MFKSLNKYLDKDTKKKTLMLFFGSLLVLCFFGYNITLWGNNYDGIMWAYSSSGVNGFDSDDYAIGGRGIDNIEFLTHIAAVAHVVYAVLLFKPFKSALAKMKSYKEQASFTPEEFKTVSWNVVVVFAFLLNIVLIVHEMNITWFTDIITFAAPYRNTSLLHYNSLFYVAGRGVIFTLLTAAYPAFIYLNKKYNK